MTTKTPMYLAALLVAAATMALALPTHAQVRELKWSDLVPKGWDPMKEMTRIGSALDDSPQAMKVLRDVWDNAPLVESLDGSEVKLPGYVVPLEYTTGVVKEFLLVPYFGACIHSPPPPANQILFVDAAAAKAQVKTMDVVWVQGKMSVKRQDSSMGVAGYRMQAAAITPYTAPKR